MNLQSKSDDGWQPCAPGELTGMVDDLERRKRNRVLTRVAGASAAGFLVVIAGVVLWSSSAPTPQQDYGGLACREVVGYFEDYYENRVDPAVAAKIEIHLAKCPHCGPHYQKFIESRESTAATVLHHGGLAMAASRCTCPSCRYGSARGGRAFKPPAHARGSTLLLARLR